GSSSTAVLADKARSDVGAAYPDNGSSHGFIKTVPAAGGFQQACFYAINVDIGANRLLRCETVWVPGGSPIGQFASAVASPGAVQVSGWVIDPDVVNPATFHVYVDSLSYGFVASDEVPMLATAQPGYGTDHGFSVSVPASAGAHSVCVYGINVGYGANTLIGCSQVTVPSASPFGALEVATGGPNGVTFSGWAIDPSAGTSPITVHVYVDGASAPTTAGNARSDIATRFPQYGANHGFSATMAASSGAHRACAYGINVGEGANSLLGCQEVVVPDGSPIGDVVAVTPAIGGANVSGWALDPDSTSPITVHIYVDNSSAPYLANGEVPALATSHPGAGTAHGFEQHIVATPGPHRICVYGINVGAGSNALIGCETVTVPSASPFGAFDSAVGVPDGVQFTGWAIDPSTPDPITVHLYVDSASWAVSANTTRSDVAAAYPSFGGDHGFAKVIPAAPGPHTVCVYGINRGPGSNALIACKNVVVPGGNPVGQMTSAVAGAGVVNVSGWALDPDVLDPITVHVYIDSASYGYVAAQEVPSLATTHPGQGTAHGFAVAVPAPPGSHRVCLYGINVSFGSNTLLECRTVVVGG